jgi:hypothetical protein
MKMIFLISVILLLQSGVFAQNQKLSEPDKKTDWWGEKYHYIHVLEKELFGDLSFIQILDIFNIFPIGTF